jgi:hypothetical protein
VGVRWSIDGIAELLIGLTFIQLRNLREDLLEVLPVPKITRLCDGWIEKGRGGVRGSESSAIGHISFDGQGGKLVDGQRGKLGLSARLHLSKNVPIFAKRYTPARLDYWRNASLFCTFSVDGARCRRRRRCDRRR